jgi:hypothetical protein
MGPCQGSFKFVFKLTRGNTYIWGLSAIVVALNSQSTHLIAD